MLLVKERFDDGDPGFLTELYRCGGGALKGFGAQWGRDHRPFARQALLRYVDDGCDRPGHRPLVKKLFKDAEDRQDDEAMRHFMVAFDRLVTTRVTEVSSYDRRTGQRGVVAVRETVEPDGGADRFSKRTRLYLQRRVYRYFRQIGYRDPTRYVTNLLEALRLYADEDTAEAHHRLDRWSLFHALYWGAPEVQRLPRGISLRPGRSLSTLRPAPRFADEWRRHLHLDGLLALMAQARNVDVRAWVRAWIESDPAAPLAAPTLSRLWPLLESPNVDAQEWGAELFDKARDLDELPVATWVELLELPNDAAAPRVADAARGRLAPERLSLDVAVEVVQRARAPVARLVLDWLMARTVTKADVPILIRLAETRDPAARATAVAWLTRLLSQHRSALLTRELLDSPHRDVRAQALELIHSHYVGAPPLAVALLESPFQDVRDEVIRHLEHWTAQLPQDQLHHLWARTILSVRNGGRAKQAALRQLAASTLAGPEHASETLPLLAVALRSVRERERRGALAAIARIVHGRPELSATVTEAIPELSFGGVAS